MTHGLFKMKQVSTEGKVLFFVLVVSAVVRLLLVLNGGAGYFPDEWRFSRSRHFYEAVMKGREDLLCPTVGADHPGFILVGLVPHLADRACDYLGHRVTWPAPFVLSLSSVAVIALVYGIASRLGAGRTERLAAAIFAATANTFFYYSRHLFPYDASLALGLLALWIGLKRDQKPLWLFSCGVLISSGFLTYSAYYVFSGVVGVLCLFAEGMTWRRLIRRGVLIGLGAAIPFLLTITVFQVLCDRNFFHELLAFGKTSRLGEHSEGWILPWIAFWYSEHALLVVWLVSLPVAAWLVLRGDDPIARHRVMLSAIVVVAIYAVFVLRVNVLEAEMMNTRRARQLVPFFCLLSAYAVTYVTAKMTRARAVRVVLLALLCLQAGYNFFNAYDVSFPRDIHRFVRETYQTEYLTVSNVMPGVQPPLVSDTTGTPRYVLVNASHLYYPFCRNEIPAGEVLHTWRHPLQFEPNLYEGHLANQRELFRDADITIRLIDTAPGSE